MKIAPWAASLLPLVTCLGSLACRTPGGATTGATATAIAATTGEDATAVAPEASSATPGDGDDEPGDESLDEDGDGEPDVDDAYDDPPEVLFPGCSIAEAQARRVDIDQLGRRFYDQHKQGSGDPRELLAELRAVLGRACLAHGAPTLELPAATTMEALLDGWNRGISYALEEMPAIQMRDGKRHLPVPREFLPALDDNTRKRLAPWLCTGAASCARTASYMARAEQVFDAAYDQDVLDLSASLVTQLPTSTCDSQNDRPDQQRAETFEAWASCINARTPRAYQYAAGARFRDLDRGWLVLRGLRGHYQWSDEIRAYDLATGAAYISSQSGGMLNAGEAQPPLVTVAGKVAPDQVRELAFYLLTRDALVRVRTSMMHAVIPDHIPLRRAPKEPVPDRASWGATRVVSSDQTTIHFDYFDGAMREKGIFTWPSEYTGVDTHADNLIRVMEAGLVKGCAPARLPPRAQLGHPPMPADAVPRERDQVRMLEQGLETLRGRACRGAK